MFAVAALLLLYLGVIFPTIALYGARQLHVRAPLPLFIRVVANKAMDEYKEEVYWFGAMGIILVRSCCTSSCWFLFVAQTANFFVY